MEYYGEIVLETKGKIMQFDVDYARCTISGNNPVSFGIDLETVKKPVAIEDDFIRTVRAAVYMVKQYDDFSNLQDCINRFSSADGECVFSFMDHEELYDVVFEKFEVYPTFVYMEIKGKTIDVVSTRQDEFTNVIVKSRADLSINHP